MFLCDDDYVATVGAGFKGQLGHMNTKEHHLPVHSPQLNSGGRGILDICCGNHTTLMLLGKHQPRSLKYLCAKAIRADENLCSKLVKASTFMSSSSSFHATGGGEHGELQQHSQDNIEEELEEVDKMHIESCSQLQTNAGGVSQACEQEQSEFVVGDGEYVLDDELYEYVMTI